MPPVIIAAVAGAASAVGTAWAAGTLATLTVATVATSAAISAAMAGASMVMAAQAKPFKQEVKDRMVSVRQPIASRQLVYGTVRTGGPITFLQSTADHTGGNKNKWLHLIIPVANHQVEGIDDVYFDDELLPLGPDGFVTGGKFFKANESNPTWRPKVYVAKHLGGPGQVADPVLVGSFGSKFTAAHVGNNVAYLYCRLEYHVDIFTSGIPNITCIVRGKRVLDVRDGVTKFTNNAALCVMDYLRLPARQGGVGAPADEFNTAHWAAAANICDELVPAGAGTERRYQLDGTVVLSSSNTPRNQLESMLTSMAGSVVYAGGQWRILPAVYRAPTVTLTADDLRDGIEVQTRISKKDTFNSIKGTHTGAETKWQPADYPALISDTAVAEDGEQIWRDIDRPFTSSAAACQRLAKIDLLRTRQPISVVMPCKLTAFRCMAGDVVNVTLARMGWAAKPFEVVEWGFKVAEDGTLGVDLSLRETSPVIFDWATSEEQTTDPAPNTDLPDWRNVGVPTNLSVDSSNSQVLEGLDGTLISRVLVSWGAAVDGFVSSYEMQWRLTGQTDWPNEQPTQQLSTYIDSVPVGTSIDVRVRAINALGVGSNYVTIIGHVVAGYSARPIPAVTGLKVVGSAAGSPGVWNTLDLTVSWNASGLGALFGDYVVEIRNTAGGALRRTITTKDPSIVYDYSANSIDGLSRAITITVFVRTKLGALSAGASLACTNPAPALPTSISLTSAFRATSLRFIAPAEQDWTGTLVWRGTATGFARNAASLVYDGPDTDIFTTATPGTQYFYRLASYDGFGKTGLLESGELTITTARVSHDDLATEIIDSSNLVSALNTEIGKIAVNATAITTEQTLRQQADDALAQQITTVSAIAGSGFNAAAAWHFETGNDNWTGSGATVAWQSDGSLRVTSSGTAPYAVSPGSQTFKGSVNRYVRARVTRVAGSGWNGAVHYVTSGHGFSGSFFKRLANPNLAIGSSTVLSWDMWSLTAGGTDWQTAAAITQIRLGLGSTAADVFDIDFVAAGVEAPGVGTAVFQEKITALADADTQIASSVTTLQTSVNGNTASIQTQQTSIGGLEAQWTVKTDVNNYVSGFGLATTVRDGTPTSSFIVSADRFAVAKPGTGGIAPTIPFVIKTIGSTPQLSFSGWARFDQIESGTVDTQTMYVGGTSVIIDGPSKSIRVNSGGVDLFRAGQLAGGGYGMEIRDSSNKVIMSSGGLGVGVVTGAALATGAGVNMAYNSDASINADGWTSHNNSSGQTITVVRNANSATTLNGAGTIAWFIPGTLANGLVIDVKNTQPNGLAYPVVAGRRYEASGYMGQFRSGGAAIGLAFLNSSGAVIAGGETYGNTVTNTTTLQTLSQYGRSVVFATAPAGAAVAILSGRVFGNGGANPYGLITRAYIGEAGANQTEASPWSPGVSTINAGGVGGLGALATETNMATARNTLGLGSLAVLNGVPWSSVSSKPAFTSFAELSQITKTNASTFVANGAFNSAHIEYLSAGLIASGQIDTAAINVKGGLFQILDSANFVRVLIGNWGANGYGFYARAGDGTITAEFSTVRNYLNGAVLGPTTVDRLAVKDGAINGIKIEDFSASNSAGATATGAAQVGVALTTVGKPVTIIASAELNLVGGAGGFTVSMKFVSNGVDLTPQMNVGSVPGGESRQISGCHVYTYTPTAAARNFFVICNTPVNRLNIWAIENRK